MSHVLPYILLAVGLVLLVKGADFFVDGSAGIARYFHVPALVIGLTIVAFGTSSPEAAVSITAAVKGQNGIAVGNVLGSNLFNLLMVVGICALIRPMKVTKGVIFKEYPLMILSGVALLALGADSFLGGDSPNMIARGDGIILLLFFCVFMYMTVRTALFSRPELAQSEIGSAPKPDGPEDKPQKISLPKNIIFAVLGLGGVIGGGQLVVNSASDIAASFGLSETLIGLTIVAIGTSLPELVTSIVAARKGESDMAIGNVVGSNLFNIFFVLAASATINPIAFSLESVIDSLIVIGVSILVYLFILIRQNVNRIEGGFMVAIYAAYTAYILLR